MYKVMIVDDELLVRIGLKTTVDWERAGFTVVAEASGGEQGLEQYRLHRPDVVFTDIKMPKGDGLWLVDAIRREDRDTRIIVLTCYDEFAYARQALKAGADDYILKSEVEDEELFALMEQIRKALDQRVRQEKVQAPVEDLKSVLMGKLLRRGFRVEPDHVPLGLEAGFDLTAGPFAFISLAMGRQRQGAGQVQAAMGSIAVTQLEAQGIPYLYASEDARHVFLVRANDLEADGLRKTLEAVGSAAGQYFDAPVSILYSELCLDAGRLPECYEAFCASEQVRFYGAPAALTLIQAESVMLKALNVIDLQKRYEGQLLELLGREKEKGAVELLEEILALCRQERYAPSSVRLLYSKLLGEVYAHFGSLFAESPEVEPYEHYHQLMDHLPELDDLSEPLSGFIRNAVAAIRQSRHRNAHWISTQAVQYIRGHYDQKISLDDVAAALILSKHYLCNVFKRETGETMSAYINRLRIEKAKQQLLMPDVRVRDVYETVGFTNQQYFSKVFKKVTGMTVSEFRDRQSE